MIDLARLSLDRKLGSGGQGKVFLSPGPSGERFALKVSALTEGVDRELVLRRAAAFRLDPSESALASILSFGLVSEAPVELRRQLGAVPKEALFVVMRFIPGQTVAASKAQKPFKIGECAAALSGIARALARLPVGVAHGDVRAPNILIRPRGEIVLADPDLSREPDAGEDLHALAALGRELVRDAPVIAGEAQAKAELEAVFGELEGHEPIPLDEAAHRFAEIAISLRAPAGEVTAVLAGRGTEADEGGPLNPPPSPNLGWGEGSIQASRRPVWIALVVAAASLLAIFAGYWLAVGRVAPVTRASADASADSLYDTTGTVHYDEPIHRLTSGEKVAASDGLIQVDFENSIARVAILTPRKELLWELKAPPEGGSVYLNAKPGHYDIEQDRDLGAEGMQQDVKLAEVDRLHPLRVTTTRQIVNSPHRPEK